MRKKGKRVVLIVLLLLAVLLIPIPSVPYADGGTKVYTSLTYKIVKWNVLLNKMEKPDVIGPDTADSVIHYKPEYFRKTTVYLFPKNFMSVEELYQMEKEKE